MYAIEIKHLSKYYGKIRGIHDLSLTVSEGDIYGFIGPNGAGKSTTIRTLLGFIRPTRGNASLLGLDMVKDHREILKKVGYMPSEANFYGNMKVKEVLSFSAGLRGLDCTKEASRLMDRFSLSPHKKIDALSLGNRKKVSLICALQHDPALYILDEPTSGLDPLMQKEFFDLLQEKNKRGATIFLSSHVLSEIERYCNHAAIIKDGTLIAAQPVETLRGNKMKRVSLYGVSSLAPLQGAKDWTASDDVIRFLYAGDMPSLLAQIHHLPLTDLKIQDPELEEIFMHFYGGEPQ